MIRSGHEGGERSQATAGAPGPGLEHTQPCCLLCLLFRSLFFEGIVDVMQSHGKQVPAKASAHGRSGTSLVCRPPKVDQVASPFAQTIDFKSPGLTSNFDLGLMSVT